MKSTDFVIIIKNELHLAKFLKVVPVWLFCGSTWMIPWKIQILILI